MGKIQITRTSPGAQNCVHLQLQKKIDLIKKTQNTNYNLKSIRAAV